jgi:hypothetical protein
MEGVGNLQIVSCREIMCDGNYDGRYTRIFTSLLIQNLENYMCIYFCCTEFASNLINGVVYCSSGSLLCVRS